MIADRVRCSYAICKMGKEIEMKHVGTAWIPRPMIPYIPFGLCSHSKLNS